MTILSQNIFGHPLRLPPEKKKKKKMTTIKKHQNKGFPGVSGVNNPPANAGDMNLIPDPGRAHMLRSN